MTGPVDTARTPLGRAAGLVAVAYVATLPLAHLVVVPVGGAAATLSDIVLAVLVLVCGGAAWGARGGAEARRSIDSSAALGIALLLGFGVWIAVSALWGFHTNHALVKGGGIVALALGAWLLGTATTGPDRLADGWLMGSLVALLVTVLFGLAGTDVLRERILYTGGRVEGLPFIRLQGPFPHPNLFGEYLFVSGVLLWWRWPAWVGRRRVLGVALAAGLAAGLALSVSSAAVAVGAGLIALAFQGSSGLTPGRRVGALACGAVLVAVTLAAAVWPITFSVAGVAITTGGGRPEIWMGALEAVKEAPLLGVGSAPFLAATTEAVAPGGVLRYWDAHSTYLSVLGQFGPVGMILFFGGLAFVARGVLAATRASDPASGRLRAALIVLAAGLLVHWVTIAGEDFRHLWALLGLGVSAAMGPVGAPWPEAAGATPQAAGATPEAEGP
ncbi:MAG TPA: O-antigen ligase family protein [Longimicrobiales bacterium]